GINLARRGYPIPRPYGDGLSPTSQSYEDYCADSPDDCDFLTLARNGGWGVGLGCIDERANTTIHCPINLDRWRKVIPLDEHIAFEPKCYVMEIPKMALVREKILSNATRRFRRDLTNDEALELLLDVPVPDCPFIPPSEPQTCGGC
ncbi:hypothetical protein FOZ61_000283, partial [Perkinsus olseni]